MASTKIQYVLRDKLTGLFLCKAEDFLFLGIRRSALVYDNRCEAISDAGPSAELEKDIGDVRLEVVEESVTDLGNSPSVEEAVQNPQDFELHRNWLGWQLTRLEGSIALVIGEDDANAVLGAFEAKR